MENTVKKPSLQMLVLITTQKLADKAADMLGEYAVPVLYRLNANGTASNEIMDMLGLGSIDKCILTGAVTKETGEAMLGKLHSKLRLDTVNSGIAFTIPMNGASKLVLSIIEHAEKNSNTKISGKDRYIMSEIKHSLITAIVCRGFSSEVMEAAKAAGAGGGTVIHSRRIATQNESGIEAIDGSEEKDIVLIIADAENRLAIMNAVSEKCGINSEAKGIITSLPIDSVMGL